jgi:hypothetical protein
MTGTGRTLLFETTISMVPEGAFAPFAAGPISHRKTPLRDIRPACPTLPAQAQ